MNADDSGFGWRATAGLTATGVVLAAAFVILGVVAPDWRDGHDGGTHALSRSAIGFSGGVALARETGMPVHLARRQGNAAAGLLVLTPAPDSDPAELVSLIRAQDNAPVLIVLPKWQTVPLERRPEWVQQIGVLPGDAAVASLARLIPGRGRARPATIPDFSVTTQSSAAGAQLTSISEIVLKTTAPATVATITGSALQPVLVDPHGRMVIGWLPVRNTYVLADPDLLDNMAMKQPATARAALDLLAQLGGRRGGVAFDLTLNGFARPYDLARLALVPPFLGVTICLAVAAGLAGAIATIRFGAPQPTARTIAFGKRALIDNAAGLIRVAHREPAALAHYAQALGDDAASSAGAPSGLEPADQAQWFAARGGAGARFAHLMAAATAATDRAAVLAAARALFFWHKDVVHDRR